jgi:hypothetical protein
MRNCYPFVCAKWRNLHRKMKFSAFTGLVELNCSVTVSSEVRAWWVSQTPFATAWELRETRCRHQTAGDIWTRWSPSGRFTDLLKSIRRASPRCSCCSKCMIRSCRVATTTAPTFCVGFTKTLGCAIDQAVSRRPCSSPRQVMWDLWWTKCYWGRFPLPILVPPTAPHSSSIIQSWYNRPVSDRRSKWTQSHPTPRN